jgi:hypothetical protein
LSLRRIICTFRDHRAYAPRLAFLKGAYTPKGLFLVITPEIRSIGYCVLIVLAGLLAACASEGEPSGRTVAGRIDDAAVREASGLAPSRASPDRLWVLNDGGAPPTLYAIGQDGRTLGTVDVAGADNRDWEDLASFEHDGRNWLLVADVGDNAATRTDVQLYLVPEPATLAPSARVAPVATTRFRFPGGPRDVESVAVDATGMRIYVLSKRTVPAELYALPLLFEDPGEILTAEYLGPIAGLPRPSESDIRQAPKTLDWYWQPTAMDIAEGLAIILTYEGVYLFDRQPGDSWYDTLNRVPARLPLGDAHEAEAACIVGDSIFVTVEAEQPPLYRFDLAGRTRGPEK